MLTEPTEMVEAVRRVWASTADLCRQLDDHDWQRPTGCPGWTVKDIVAHMVWGQRLQLGHDEPEIDLPADLPHVSGEIGAYMERAVHARRPLPPAEVLAELEACGEAAGALLAGLSPDDFAVEIDGPLGFPVRRRSFLRIQVFDQWAHEQDIRRAVGRSGHLEGPAPEHGRDIIAAGWGQTLPKAADVSEPTVVVVDVTGPSARRFALDLSQQPAVPTDEPPPGHEAAATLTVPFEAFVALGCGRAVPADQGRGQVAVEGDRALADRLLDHLAVTP